MMKSRFEHFLTTKNGKFILRGKLKKDERFSLCLIRRELSDRWSKDFNPLLIHSICSHAGNVKKMLVIWEILYNYKEDDENYQLDCIFNPNESLEENSNRIFLIIEEKTPYQTSKIPLPLDHMPFTYEEYQENCKYLYNRIYQLECIKLAQEREISELKSQILKERNTSNKTKKNMKSSIKKLQSKIKVQDQKELTDRLSKPKFAYKKSMEDYQLEEIRDIWTGSTSSPISSSYSTYSTYYTPYSRSSSMTKSTSTYRSSSRTYSKSSSKTPNYTTEVFLTDT